MRYQEERETDVPGSPPSEGQSRPVERARYNPAHPPWDHRSALTSPDPSLNATRRTQQHPSALHAKENEPYEHRTLFGFIFCLASLAIGFVALKNSPAAKIGPYGLIQALSPLYYVALILLVVSFSVSLKARQRRPVLLATHLVILVFLTHGAPTIIEGIPRFQTAYLHVGFTGYIANTGKVLHYYDARFSWPSFFEAMAMLQKVAGVSSSETFLLWWPVVINLLYLPLIHGIANNFLQSKLKAWVAAGVFPLINWVDQDYFSPQSLAFLLYLTFIFILVVPLGARDRPAWRYLLDRTHKGPSIELPWHGQPQSPRPCTTAFYLGLLFLLILAMATSHQLTPVMAIITTLVLVASGRTRVRGMALVVPLVVIGWICYGTIEFWSNHLNMVFGGLFNVGGNVGSGVTQRLSGNPAHELTVKSRVVIAAVVWGLSSVGALVWRRTRKEDSTVVALLFFAAFSLILGGNYGGEGVLRVYLFSLPGAACLIAALISRLPQFWHSQVALACTLTLLIPLFLLAAWGNELYEMVTPGELATTDALTRIAPPGSRLVSANAFVNWRYQDLTEFIYTSMGIEALGPQTLGEVTAALTGNSVGSYFIITADQEAYGWLVDGMPRDWGSTLENTLKRSSNFKLRYANPDGAIFQYIPSATNKRK